MKDYFWLVFLFLFFSCNKDEIQEIEGVVINPSYSVVTDNEGNEYKTVILNNIEWLAENLRTTTYCNGDSILNLKADSLWVNTDSGAWSHYENDDSFSQLYGKLYNFHAIKDERNICPCGWRVPNHNDWNNLIMYLGGQIVAGGKLKLEGTDYWQNPNFAATNESGFSAIPNSYRFYTNGDFEELGFNAYFWADDYSWYGTHPLSSVYVLEHDRGRIQRRVGLLNSGLAVRCVRDV